MQEEGPSLTSTVGAESRAGGNDAGEEADDVGKDDGGGDDVDDGALVLRVALGDEDRMINERVTARSGYTGCTRYRCSCPRLLSR